MFMGNDVRDRQKPLLHTTRGPPLSVLIIDMPYPRLMIGAHVRGPSLRFSCKAINVEQKNTLRMVQVSVAGCSTVSLPES